MADHRTQWTLYRMKLLAERFAKYAKNMEEKRAGMAEDYYPEVITKEEVHEFCNEQIEYLTTSQSFP